MFGAYGVWGFLLVFILIRHTQSLSGYESILPVKRHDLFVHSHTILLSQSNPIQHWSTIDALLHCILSLDSAVPARPEAM